MADPHRRLPDNAAGTWFVDDSCIDCGTCRWIDPAHFAAGEGHAFVATQPADPTAAARAAVSCPTASIGGDATLVGHAAGSFPHPVLPDVLHCGFHDEATYGAASWLVIEPTGNTLVDVPRFSAPLVRRIEALGGVHRMLLTHIDDVGAHERWAQHFGAERVMHRADRRARVFGVERFLDGEVPVEVAPGWLALPTPGHTRGSTCFLWREVLFTGDHLAYSHALGHLYAFWRACWYDWQHQLRAMATLQHQDFAHVLPGHGAPWHGMRAQAQAQLQRCLQWMAAPASVHSR